MYAMETIYDNAECIKLDNPTPSTNYTGQRSSKRSFYLGVILSLSLLTVFLLTGLITLRFFYHNLAEHVSAEAEKRDLLNKNISALSNQLSSMTEERDLLTKKLLCLYNQNKPCLVGWRNFSCSCYLLSESSASWDAARKDCRGRGADLVVIDYAEEQTFLSMITTNETWIGLNDKEQEGTWKWVDGTPLTLTYWGKSQPNGGEEDCVYVTMDEGRFWNDYYCSSSHQWIFENTPNHNKTCPVGWSFSHSCYLVSKSSGSWDAARKDCRHRGADLVVINSHEEQTEIVWREKTVNRRSGGRIRKCVSVARIRKTGYEKDACSPVSLQNFLSTITTEGVWIGLNDKVQEGTWKWVDGTPLTLSYWAKDQPDNGGEEDCVSVRSEKNIWFDRPCSSSHQWICEKLPENN